MAFLIVLPCTVWLEPVPLCWINEKCNRKPGKHYTYIYIYIYIYIHQNWSSWYLPSHTPISVPAPKWQYSPWVCPLFTIRYLSICLFTDYEDSAGHYFWMCYAQCYIFSLSLQIYIYTYIHIYIYIYIYTYIRITPPDILCDSILWIT